MNGRRRRLSAFLAVLALVASGCAGVGNSGGGTGGVDPVPPAPVAPGGIGGGGVIGGPIVAKPGIGSGSGELPSIEDPIPGQLNPKPVNVWEIQPTIDGHHVTVLLSWWGGVAPCFVFDSVILVRDGKTIRMTPREGTAPNAGKQACDAIAKLKGTIVDLGELEAGTWILAASGDLAPISVTVK